MALRHVTLMKKFTDLREQVTESLPSFIGRRSPLVLSLSKNERKSMTMVDSKLYLLLTLCREIVTAAIVLTWFTVRSRPKQRLAISIRHSGLAAR